MVRLFTAALLLVASLPWSPHARGQSPSPLPPPPYPSTAFPEALPSYPSTAFPDAFPLELGERSSATGTSTVEELAAPTGEPTDLDVEVEVEEPPHWYQPSYWIRLPGWDTAVELGLNGSSGTSDSLSLRTGGYVKKKSEERKVNFELYHNRTQAGGVETQNNAQMKFRHDWLMPDSPWTLYVQSQLYYDEFQAFDLNLNLNAGVGYRLIDKDWVELTTRVGSGTSRKFGGVDDEWVPEAQLGVDYEQKFSETQKLTASNEYFPDWGDFGRFRLLTEVGYEVELAVPSNVSLKVAATNRHDSHPDGAEPNNLNYSVLLLWKL